MPRSLLVLLLVLVAACSQSPAVLASADREDLVSGLCAALDVSAPEASKAAFLNRAHVPLHTLADALRSRDLTDVSAELLVAKQRVEASYEQDLPAALLLDNLETLHAAVDDGLTALDLPAIACEGPPE